MQIPVPYSGLVVLQWSRNLFGGSWCRLAAYLLGCTTPCCRYDKGCTGQNARDVKGTTNHRQRHDSLLRQPKRSSNRLTFLEIFGRSRVWWIRTGTEQRKLSAIYSIHSQSAVFRCCKFNCWFVNFSKKNSILCVLSADETNASKIPYNLFCCIIIEQK